MKEISIQFHSFLIYHVTIVICVDLKGDMVVYNVCDDIQFIDQIKMEILLFLRL